MVAVYVSCTEGRKTIRILKQSSVGYDAHMVVLLLGARGYLGTHILSVYPDARCSSVDIADAQAVAAVLERERPDVVINAAGKTGRPNVDWCEEHKEETLRSNVTGPLVLLEQCAKRGTYWVHLGSGCIYEGDNGGRGFAEDDAPNFTSSFYSHTKSWCDSMLQEFPHQPILNLRIRMPFDGTTEPRNLLTKLRGYTRVLDVQNSLTYIPDFLQALSVLVAQRARGTFNIVNDGTLSPYEVMMAYREQVDPAHTFERLTLEALPSVVKAARSNCVLSNAKAKAAGVVLLPAQEALAASLRALRSTRGDV